MVSAEPSVPAQRRIETVRGDSPLGPWRFDSWSPPTLTGLVDHLWAFTGPTRHLRKRIFPNGCVEILLNFGEPYRLVEGAGDEVCRDAWVGGPQVGAMVVEQPRYQDVIGVRLRPTAAHAVLGVPMDELTGLSVDLADVVGAVAKELIERCTEAGSVVERLSIAARFIADRIARGRPLDPAIAWSVSQLDETGGAISIAALRDHTGLSKSRLVSAFRRQVGPAPKVYARVVRFHRALALLQSGASERLTDIAFDACFYDQPHMNAEFRALGGITPTQFLAARHPVGDGSTASDGCTVY